MASQEGTSSCKIEEGESSLIFTPAEGLCQVNIVTVQIFAWGKGKVEHDIERSFDNTDLLNLGGILKRK